MTPIMFSIAEHSNLRRKHCP